MTYPDVNHWVVGGIIGEDPDIIRAAKNNDLEEAEVILRRDPKCINDTENDTGVTALHIAAADGNMSMVDFLCRQPGIDPLCEDYFGRSPAQIAIAIGRADIAERVSAELRHSLQNRIAEENDQHNDGTVVGFTPKSPKPR